MTELSLIVAMDQNRLIGSDNQLPWHLPADLKFFKQTTLGKPIVMGRKTFESIGKALPGRRNIVVTRNAEYRAEGCEIAADIDSALALCDDADEIMLIGGASLYEQSMERATNLYITEIHHVFSGDTWFPEIDKSIWREEIREDHDADHSNPYAFSFIKFVREF